LQSLLVDSIGKSAALQFPLRNVRLSICLNYLPISTSKHFALCTHPSPSSAGVKRF